MNKLKTAAWLLAVAFWAAGPLAAQTRYDVLVLGGGASGTTAGIQAARQGARTLVVEPGPWLGGMLTAAGVTAIDGNHQLPSGLFGEFVAALAAHYGGPQKLQTGWVSHVQYEPKVGARVLQEIAAREQNLSLLLNTQYDTPTRKNGFWQVRLHEKNGLRHTVQATELIDATELGDVAAALGVPADVGMDARHTTGEGIAPEQANGIIQDLTFVATLKDYGTPRPLPRPPGYDSAAFACACRTLCPDTTRPRLHPCDKMLTYGKLPNGYYMINWPIQGNDFYANLITATPAQRDSLVQAAKAHTLRFVYFIQHELGYRHLGLADDQYPTADGLPMIPYHRESRRIRGVVRFTMEHIARPFAQHLYRTGVAVGDYPIDHHHAVYPGGLPDLHFYPVPSYSLPGGTLLPAATDHLLVAEKSISVTNLANGTTRLQPVVMQIGQAAGALAALAARQGKSPRQVGLREWQAALLAQKVYLMPYHDVPADHPDWAAIQRIGATGLLRGTPEPFKWANHTWFYPDSTLTGRELVQAEHDFFGKAANAIVADKKLYFSDLTREIQATARLSGYRCGPLPTGYATNRPLTRAEVARLLDAWLDAFSRKAINWQGDWK